MHIKQNLPEKYIPQVTELFLSALGEKFIPILGNNEKSKKLFALSLNLENCFYAEEDSMLLGVVAFQTSRETFFAPTLKSIQSLYGKIKGLYKGILLSLMEHKTEQDELYIEAIAVSTAARGKGVGTQLLEIIFTFAKEKGLHNVTLQVIDTNPRAKTLYEKNGFTVIKKENIWPINKIIGWPFNRVYVMIKSIY